MDSNRLVGTAARALVALGSAAVLAATGLGWGLQHEVAATLVTSRVITAPPVVPGHAFTALLVGLDARTDADGNPLPAALLDALHAGPDEGELHTDSLILLHVPAETDGTAVAVSIPRDSYVALGDGSGRHKINSSYARGLAVAERGLIAHGVSGAPLDRLGREAGRAALIATVSQFMGVTIDHYAEINLAGFVELTDALGGVPVCLRAPAHDDYSGIDLPAGFQTVTGAGALAFVRQRHGLVNGDLDRIARQQAFIAGLAQRLEASGTLTDPTTVATLLGVATRHVVVDQGWDVAQAVGQVGRLAGSDIRFRTIPIGRSDLRTPADGEAVQVDPATVRAFVATQFADVAPDATPTPTGTPTGTPPTPAAPARATPPPPTTSPLITAGGVPCVD